MTTRAWDETTPLDSNHAGEGAERLRELRVDIHERLLHLCSVGTVMKYADDFIPYGWRQCNGDSLLISSFPELYAVIGKTYGGTSGLAPTFRLPDYRGKILRGWNHGKSSGLYDPDAATRTITTASGSTMTAGDHVGTEQVHEYRAHTHSYLIPDAYASRANVWDENLDLLRDDYYDPQIYADRKTTLNTAYTPTTDTETRPINKRVNYIIRVEGIESIPVSLNPAPSGHSYLNTWSDLKPDDEDPMGDGAQEIRDFKVDFAERLEVMFPIGSMVYWTSSVIPEGWMECDGSALLVADYQDLYDVIGTKWGGSGTTFNLPLLNGYFVKGSSETTYCSTVEAGQLTKHYHSYWGGNNFWSYGKYGANETYLQLNNALIATIGYYPPLPTTDTRPKNIYLPLIIRVSGNS